MGSGRTKVFSSLAPRHYLEIIKLLSTAAKVKRAEESQAEYGGVSFVGDPKLPGPASLVLAVTGRDALIKRLEGIGDRLKQR
jgi:hypothetical protein